MKTKARYAHMRIPGLCQCRIPASCCSSGIGRHASVNGEDTENTCTLSYQGKIPQLQEQVHQLAGKQHSVDGEAKNAAKNRKKPYIFEVSRHAAEKSLHYKLIIKFISSKKRREYSVNGEYPKQSRYLLCFWLLLYIFPVN